MVIAFARWNPFPASQVKKYQTILLQASVVGLGAGMNLKEILSQGLSSIPSTLILLGLIWVAGMGITRLLKLSSNLGVLLSGGTAICGGSAIAALAPVLRASSDETAIALGAVFILNSVGLVLFPWLGHQLQLTQEQFGMFAALAIHDTSSVVGAASVYGPVALKIATTTKLVRALWIAPLCLAVSAWMKRKQAQGSESTSPVSFPKFILYFLLMATLSTLLADQPLFTAPLLKLHDFARLTLVGSIFFIGLGFNPEAVRRVGAPTLFAAVLLWLVSITAAWIVVR